MLDDADENVDPTAADTAPADQPASERSTRDATERSTRDGADAERLHERLRAVERAITDDDRSLPEIDDAATADRLDEFDDRLGEIEERVAELEAATQALRGYVGSVRAVNREVERRADLALATATKARNGVSKPDAAVTDSNATAPDRNGAERSSAVAAAVPDGRGVDATVDDVRRAVDEDTPVDDEFPVDDGFPTDDESAGDTDSPVDDERDVIARLREVL